MAESMDVEQEAGGSKVHSSPMYNYVVTAQQATAVTHAVVGHFTGPGDVNLILGCVGGRQQQGLRGSGRAHMRTRHAPNAARSCGSARPLCQRLPCSGAASGPCMPLLPAAGSPLTHTPPHPRSKSTHIEIITLTPEGLQVGSLVHAGECGPPSIPSAAAAATPAHAGEGRALTRLGDVVPCKGRGQPAG